MRQHLIPLLVFILTGTGVAITTDAMFVSADEQLDSLGEALGEGLCDERLRVLQRHLDPDRHPIRIQTRDAQISYGPDDHEALEAWLEEGPLSDDGGRGWHLLQSAVSLHGGHGGEHARASITTRSRIASSERTVVYKLVRDNQHWLVSRIRVL